MSMIARFVALAPDRLAQVLEAPDSVRELFSDFAGDRSATLPPFAQAPSLLVRRRAQMAQQAPAMLADTLERLNPALKQALAERLAARGIKVAELRGGTQNEALMKLMEERMAVMRGRGGRGLDAGQRAGAAARAQLSLDKAWHGVHYLLCGLNDTGDDTLGQVIMGGAEIGGDEGYGPARYFKPAEVTVAATELNADGLEAQMRSRFDPAAMQRLEIYPGRWEAASLAWLLQEYRKLRSFFADASSRRAAVITCLV